MLWLDSGRSLERYDQRRFGDLCFDYVVLFGMFDEWRWKLGVGKKM